MIIEKNKQNIWAALGVLGLLMIVSHYLHPVYAFYRPSPLPDLVRGLPQDLGQADLAFRQRIIDRFPLGSPANILVRDLQRQGFMIDQNSTAGQGSFMENTPVCNSTWTIRWGADAKGNLTDVRGQFSTVCL